MNISTTKYMPKTNVIRKLMCSIQLIVPSNLKLTTTNISLLDWVRLNSFQAHIMNVVLHSVPTRQYEFYRKLHKKIIDKNHLFLTIIKVNKFWVTTCFLNLLRKRTKDEWSDILLLQKSAWIICDLSIEKVIFFFVVLFIVFLWKWY